MKKFNLIALIVLTIMTAFAFSACKKDEGTTIIDYSEYAFTNTLWTRKAEHDIEFIRFGSDGSFTYYCSCGNPVNDSDLNDGYTYDDATKTITINYIETTEETISAIKIEECDGESIKLTFDGEAREFVKDKD